VNFSNTVERVAKRSRMRLIASLASAAALTVAVCITAPVGASSATAKSAKITVGIAAITEGAPVVVQAIAVDQQIAKILGFKLVVLNANGNPAQMAQVMSALVEQNVSAILDIAISPSNAPAAFAAAKQKHIPIIGQLGPLSDPTHLSAVSYGPSDAKMAQLLSGQILKDYPTGGQALSLNASAQLPIVIRYQTMAKELAGVVTVASAHETDLSNPVADTQTAVADAIHANSAINMVWALQDFEFATSVQTIAAQNLGNVGVFSFYLDPEDFGILRSDASSGNKEQMAVVDSPVYLSGWYGFDAIVNKFVLHKKNWITPVSIHPWPYVVVTPANVRATGDVYNYPSYRPFFVKHWKSEGVKVKG
jgi:ABC-type sugar transport system substrate-binding protein